MLWETPGGCGGHGQHSRNVSCNSICAGHSSCLAKDKGWKQPGARLKWDSCNNGSCWQRQGQSYVEGEFLLEDKCKCRGWMLCEWRMVGEERWLKIIIMIKASSMKQQTSWQTAQRISIRRRKYVWCHPEANLKKLFAGNVFWKRRFRAVSKNGCGRSPSAMSCLQTAVPGEKCKNRTSFGQCFPTRLPQPPVTCDSGASVTDYCFVCLFVSFV